MKYFSGLPKPGIPAYPSFMAENRNSEEPCPYGGIHHRQLKMKKAVRFGLDSPPEKMRRTGIR